MPSKRINRVALEKFRGATTTTSIEFDVSKPIVLIFGENGSGKSTIANAFDFVCNRSKGSLEKLSSTDHSHIVSIGSDPADLKVRLFRDEETWEGTQQGRKILVEPSEEIPAASILRRRQLLKLVEATPSERFDTIRAFVDFGAIELSEQKLRDAERKARQDLDRKIELHTQAKDSLRRFWEAGGQIDGSPEEWAAGKLAQNLSESRVTLSSYADSLSQMESFIGAKCTLDSLQIEVETAETELDALKRQIAAQENASEQLGLVSLLDQLRTVIAEPYNRNLCPACESEYNLADLRRNVDLRIELLQESGRLSKELSLRTETLKNKQSLLNRASATLLSGAKALQQGLSRVKQSANDVVDPIEAVLSFDLEGEYLNEEDTSGLSSAVDKLKPLIFEKVQDLSKDINLYDSLKAAVDLSEKTELEVRNENDIANGLKAALDVVHGSRIRRTKEILEAVQGDVLRFWEAIHPDEPIKPTKLSLNDTTRGSLEQFASFGGHDDIIPQAYFSESHLDTLGFCYWLAIAKYSSNGDTILVLDDVFTSVDSAHISRIVDLLTTESENFNQILVTTHQRRWLNAYKFGIKAKAKASVMELGVWSVDAGISLYPSPMEFEKLKQQVATEPLDRQAVCSKAGVLIEQMFDELTIQYRCGMPRVHPPEYTLANYWDGTTKLFKKLKIHTTNLLDEEIEVPLAELHQKLHPYIGTRNQVGAHFNPSEEEFSDGDVREFAKLTLELAETLLCSECIGLSNKRNRNDGVWQCECGKTKMSPYET